ncbi:MAG: NAD(P)-binding domain-containing protein [Ignavibacteriae bacterium]|nr:NAD(P)-binding domain-containing protein [Ignavibacteriota bacterium]
MTLDLIIIGAGPAGISMASEARAAGVPAERMLVLEKAAEHSFTLKKYYPDNKLVTANYKGFEAACTGVLCIPDLSKSETITYLTRRSSRMASGALWGNSAKLAQDTATGVFTLSTDKRDYTAKVVVIAIGILGKPNKPDYPLPRTLTSRLLFDVTSTEIKGDNVLVVGGGDSASEYCQYLAQQGNTVTLSYRRDSFPRMNSINRASLLSLGERGNVRLMLGSDIETVKDNAGKPIVHFNGGTQEQFDYVVYALGGSTPENFLKMIGIAFDGPAPVLKEGHETSVPGLFLVGDLSAGSKGGSIIWAFNSANTAMRKICDDYLGCTVEPLPGDNTSS